MTQLLAPDHSLPPQARRVVFLAGSIDMGTAKDWQKDVNVLLHQGCAHPIWVCNPRRLQWDNSWEQSIDNPLFHEQVTWELDHLERCDVALFYFQAGSMSPITLMELGHRLGTQKSGQSTVVCCPKGYWRKGNVDILCERYHVLMVDDLTQLAVVGLSLLE